LLQLPGRPGDSPRPMRGRKILLRLPARRYAAEKRKKPGNASCAARFRAEISGQPSQRLELALIIERECVCSRTGERTGSFRRKSGTAQDAGHDAQADVAGGKRLPHSYTHDCIHFSVKIFIPSLDKRQGKIQPAG
ncbi:MAG: hypothetical protein U0M13_11255, partial [Desulfovibrio fairfieldensis]|nr:hypothetical protein [Desulfovibrio fairfieldensis]